jgi:hypothetical protein
VDESFAPLGRLLQLSAYALVCLGLLGGGFALLSSAEEPSANGAERAANGFTASSWAPPPTNEIGSPAVRQITHDEPPDPEMLRNAPAAQAYYDATAQPGDFVTPPTVSIEH